MKYSPPLKKIRVGILGATGTVGQKFIVLLAHHPWFEITALAASHESAGKRYETVMENRWKQDVDMPSRIKRIIIRDSRPPLPCDFVFSGLDAHVAGDIERIFAKAGYPVVSNAKNFRMEHDVPLIIPEVNPDHLASIPVQQKRRRWKGFIVTNPNCVAIPLAIALKPLHAALGIKKVSVTSMQAISGAGYPGVPSLDILGNVIPYIGGEEPKVETEPLKLLGSYSRKGFSDAHITISAQCNRVPVHDGHFLTVSFSTKKPATVARLRRLIQTYRGEPQKLKLPSAPKEPLIYLTDDTRPQPRLDRNRSNGMAVTIGRLRVCPILGYKMVVLGHNTIRGAAGAAILNAELLYAKGHIAPREK